jgi:hypothetical protein
MNDYSDGNDQTVYLVAEDLRRPGRACTQADYEPTEFETAIQDLLTGHAASRFASSRSILQSAGRKMIL